MDCAEDVIEIDVEADEDKDSVRTIRHLVISGGGLAGFSFYGILKASAEEGIWSMANIRTIYGTSIGSILAATLALQYPWSTMDDFWIKRPWHQVLKVDMFTLIDSIENRGVFNIQVIEKVFAPLLLGKDLSVNITLADFYAAVGIEIHVFTVDIQRFELVDISHLTHGHWRLVDAIYSSCALPSIFTPHCIEGEYYCDGGILCNYPVEICIRSGANPREILGVRHIFDVDPSLTKDSTLIDYMCLLVTKCVKSIGLNNFESWDSKLEYAIPSSLVVYNLMHMQGIASNPAERARLIAEGGDYVRERIHG
jgi:hypothetical protein